MIRSRKLPLSQLALGSGAEKKTLERHRKYLIAILLAFTNGFEIIRGHLSQMKKEAQQNEISDHGMSYGLCSGAG